MIEPSRKRPADVNQLAKLIAEIATGQVEDCEPAADAAKNPAAVRRGKLGGQIGGKVRASRMSPEERSAAASKAVQARWDKRK